MDPFHRGFEKLLQIENYIQGELSSRDVVSSVVCGGIAGMVAKTAIAPAERVKMSFQVSKDAFDFQKAIVRGRRMVLEDGVFGLWRGHSTTLLRVAPFAGISYATHDYAEKYFQNRLQSKQLPFAYKFLAGSISGALGTVATYPLDVFRVRLALTPGLSWMGAIKQKNYFRGLSPTLLGIIPYSGTAWGTKQSLREFFHSVTRREPNLVEQLLINAIAGYSQYS